MATGLDGFGPTGERGDLLAVEGGKYLGKPPMLAVEVLSPSSRRIDRLSKLPAYEAGVASYWLVDPAPETPSLHALNLVERPLRRGRLPLG